eukprot:TRINITY_DN1238_c0_g1_i1.p1 TRINITY_DN1238_c0_g1~~TRINITY_DN1238_c0_g1_i1.p1  ORF type:complete len:292 (-),score=29.92 TRINITY_DN1238_c0_g1_i1:698-1573(-)
MGNSSSQQTTASSFTPSSRESSFSQDNELFQLAEDLTCKWMIPNSAIDKLISINNSKPITMDRLKNYFTQLGLERVWLTQAQQVFQRYEQYGQVNMQSFFIAIQKTKCVKSSQKQLEVSELPTIFSEVYEEPKVPCKYVGLVAHNHMKSALISFVEEHVEQFKQWPLVTTGSTGASLAKKLGIKVSRQVSSGPLGGDQEIGAMLSQGQVAALFFFQDPLDAHPHQHDIHALVRLCDVYQVPFATNKASAMGLLGLLQTMGTEWQLGESQVVQTYKANQKKVIASHAKEQTA